MRKSLMRITLRQLQVFNEVCDLRSYSRAAQEMSLTQPAVSLQIRQLEDVVGQPLFEYVGKKLYLTEAAEALQRASRDIFGRLESFDMQLADMQGALQGQLKLAVESSAKYFVPHLFAAFKRQHPEVNLNLTVVNRAQVIRRLSDNRDDLIIMSMVPQDMGLDFLPFLNNPLVALAPPEHPLCRRKQLKLRELESETLLLREQGSGTRQACEEFFKEKRVHFSQTLEVASQEAQKECVIAGLGIALMTRHAASLELRTGVLQELPVDELPIYRSWCVVKSKLRRQSPVSMAFLTFIREQRQQISVLAERFANPSALPPATVPSPESR
ncbi:MULTISPECIES: LysR family transcriptional regulator [unclassified Pseudomonas]|uniref:LysR family transcriptional regulator n=1 Tax=unclassified Pseudomonas TaxID=196821 RepID=UPI000BD85E05|nr:MULTISPECIES: LysR family transcriptional regulator [unclassified Pseudomonas]PVZ10491.1 DNA-binding transcriptional LysR family regulator [Pseudomonas sp. URIL14HWK12:I12]PVZ21917.1 DNA-binding transcriptional LysR family regulator [Pseudomonas sp. URIL14HWK12:I10]PVZ31000.1 DNA-binding transcriptional LysR family regulator [Pseudomonas sp. URIL14HWK12:I11]SNZ17518.1 transcriptional regulator, LysR family [Pseudomonas sp. URIL14HWK12:I9]